jgi:prepilin-type N-terminal cleavage/methylation domain-containing protein
MQAPEKHLRKPDATGRLGLTLIELLVVMVILTIITAASIPLLTTGVEQRRVREAARLVSSYISSAKTRAIETGRPAGVMVQCFNNAGSRQFFSYSLVAVEVPTPYAGDTTGSAALVSSQSISGITYGGYVNATLTCGTVINLGFGNVSGPPPAFGNPDYGWQGQVRIGDLIRFGYQGRWYVILGVATATTPGAPMMGSTAAPTTPLATGTPISASPSGTVSGSNPSITAGPWVLFATDGSGAIPAANTTNPGVPFQILRQPVKSAVPPLQLPEGVVVDLYNSGIGTSGNLASLGLLSAATANFVLSDPVLTFSPTGGVDFVYWPGSPPQHLQSTLYMLIGRREGMFDPTTVDVNPGLNATFQPVDPSNPPNLVDMNNMWVAVSPQSGLVVTTENANTATLAAADVSGGATVTQFLTHALPVTRAFAQAATSTGGR